MNPLLVAVAVALLVPAFTHGSYRRLAHASFAFVPILLAGLVLQVVLDFGWVPESRWHDVGFGLLVASMVLVIGFCVTNLDHPGMGVVLVGVLANTLAIVANQGMPVDVPQQWLDDGDYTETVKHHLQTSEDDLLVLTDIIPIPGPFQTVISFGDIIIVVGVVVVVYHASRRSRSDRRGFDESEGVDVDVDALLRASATEAELSESASDDASQWETTHREPGAMPADGIPDEPDDPDPSPESGLDEGSRRSSADASPPAAAQERVGAI